VTVSPRLSRRAPIDAAAKPLPKEERTPPVIKMNLVREVGFEESMADTIATWLQFANIK
jgi:hypothetical protein